MLLDSVRPSPIAGRWYEGDAARLADRVDSFMDSAVLPTLEGELLAVIAPHAGHVFSGGVAGHAFAALRGMSVDLVAIVSPMHEPQSQPFLTTAHGAYGTPLGSIEVDRAAVEELDAALQSAVGIGVLPIARDREHSLEIELPFLQRALAPGWRLMPVMVHSADEVLSEHLGASLGRVLRGRRVILVGSTDLSHYVSHQAALRLDRAMLGEIEALSPAGMFEAERTATGFACGLGAVAAVLWAALGLGADHAVTLCHATSGQVTGDLSSVVGYGAAAVLRRLNRPQVTP